MSSNTAQWRKEARQMAWPWAIVTGAGLLVLARPWFNSLPDLPGMAGVWGRLMEWILPIGTFFGTAILAVLPLGAEFQYRTLAMRMAQPIDRSEVWRQKFFLTIAAVVPAAIIYCIAISIHDGRPVVLATAAWILVTTFAALPCTILAGTIIGGIVMTQLAGFWVMLSWMYYERHHSFPDKGLWAAAVVIVAFAILMAWLGRRMIVRYQAADGMQAREDFVPGAQLVPDAVARWFQCRSQQPIANLIRREIRLSRVLWLLIAVNVLAWICLVVFHLLPNQRTGETFVAFGITAIVGLIIAVLAGTLSLGEEKTWGTHDWHMTVPISITTQWAVKLFCAVGTSVVGVALVPMVIVALGHQAGASKFLTSDVALKWVLEAAGITFVAFWCACVVKNTIQATLWVFPLCFGVGLAGAAGSWVLGPFDASLRHWVRSVVAWLDPLAVGRTFARLFHYVDYDQLMAVVIAPLLAVALIQTLRNFRAQFGANKLRVVRCALPLMMVTFLWGAVGVVFFQTLSESWKQTEAILRETDQAIGVLRAQDDGANAVSRQATAEDLAKAAPLSEPTKRWLRNADLTIASTPENVGGPGPYFPGRMLFIVGKDELKGRGSYSAVVRNAQGNDCTMMLQVRRGTKPTVDVGYLTVVCQ